MEGHAIKPPPCPQFIILPFAPQDPHIYHPPVEAYQNYSLLQSKYDIVTRYKVRTKKIQIKGYFLAECEQEERNF